MGWTVDDVDRLERQGYETVYVIEVEKQNQEVDLYYSGEGVLVKSMLDDDRDDKYLPEQNAQLTEAMKTFIHTKYPGYRLVEIDIEDDGQYRGFVEVDIIHFDNDLNRNVVKEVLFDRNNEWYSTSWDVRQNELPATVTHTLSNQYNGYYIDEAERIERADGRLFYRIELERGNAEVTLNIEDNGSIIP